VLASWLGWGGLRTGGRPGEADRVRSEARAVGAHGAVENDWDGRRVVG
jgi:hypothetical protein